MARLPNHPCTLNVLTLLKAASPRGMQRSSLVASVDGKLLLAPVSLLRELVALSFVTSTTTPVTADSVLFLTASGHEAFDENQREIARERERADEGAFALVHQVLEGQARPSFHGTASKMLRIMMDRDSDTVISSEHVVVHFGRQRQRRPNSYFRRLAPPAIGELLARAGVERIATPVVMGLPAAAVPRTAGFPAWSYAAKLVWLVPGEDMVKVMVRQSPEAWRAPYVGDIPSEGPLALRELPEWTRQETWTNFSEPVTCPHCGESAISYRQTHRALVCASCARSFEHG